MLNIKSKILISFSSLLLLTTITEANDYKCIKVETSGEKCDDLHVEFNFSTCTENKGKHIPRLNCKNDTAHAVANVNGVEYKADLKLYVGTLGDKIWISNQGVKAAKEKTNNREIASNLARKSPIVVLKNDPPPKLNAKKDKNSATAVAVENSTTNAQTQVQTPEKTQAETPSQEPKDSSVTSVPLKSEVTNSPSPQFSNGSAILLPNFKSNALLQFWYTDDSTPSALEKRNNFRIRRAEFKFSGNTTPDVEWYASLDFAKSLATTSTAVVTGVSPTTTTNINQINTDGDNKVIQDFGIVYKLSENVNFVVGQFKTQTVAESHEATSDLLFPERSVIARTYGESRDTGAQLIFKNDSIKATFMVGNGQSANVNDSNTDKDVSTRIDLMPWKSVKFGGFMQVKQSLYDQPQRYGFNLGLAVDSFNFKIDNVVNINNGIRSEGNTVDFSYQFDEKFQLASRHEYIQPDKTVEYKASATSVGLNYRILKNNSKIQLMHSTLNNLKGNYGSSVLSEGDRGSLLILGFQSSF